MSFYGEPFHDEHNLTLPQMVDEEARGDWDIEGPDDDRPTRAELLADEAEMPRWQQRQNSNRTVGEGHDGE